MARRERRRWGAACVVLAAFAAPRVASAQNKPFPHAAGYVAGFTSTRVTSGDAEAIYARWKREYLEKDCGDGTYRVEFQSPAGSTVSEGMGYGMLLAVYFGDRAAFDGLWRFVRENLNANSLMGWKVTCAGFDRSVGGAGSATDGDADIAMALVAAVDQWGEAYRPPAREYLSALEAHDFTTCRATGRVMATNGDWDRGCHASNSSYWTPAYDRVFEEFTHDSFWGRAASDATALWLVNRNATTGLVANEVNEDGTVGDNQSYVDYNGCRVPWRAVLEYLWYGTAEAKNVTDKITDWVDTRGPANLFDGYNTDGSARTGSRWNGSDCFNGGYATAAMSKSQDRVDLFTRYFASLTVDNYYETSLRALYALMLSGNLWKPGPPVAPPVVSPRPAVAPANRSADADVTRRGGLGCSLEGQRPGAWPALLLLLLLPLRWLRRRVEVGERCKSSF
jgi:endo-1,4-beta-D-glucanase Y